MAGHSKWANIKHRKGNQDAIRSRVFQKLSKEITVAVTKGGGSNPESNHYLKLAILKAKAKSMPKSNIDRAISSGNNFRDENKFKEVFYSGNGFNGISFIVFGITDNLNRFTSNIQTIFRKYKVTIGKQGHVPFTFNRRGILEFSKEKINQEKLMDTLLEEEIIDFEENENFLLYVNPNNFIRIRKKLENVLNIKEFLNAEITFVANQKVNLEEDKIKKFREFLDLLEEDNDVQEIFHNAVGFKIEGV